MAKLSPITQWLNKDAQLLTQKIEEAGGWDKITVEGWMDFFYQFRPVKRGPRKCALSSCSRTFTPENPKGKFCCHAHRSQWHRENRKAKGLPSNGSKPGAKSTPLTPKKKSVKVRPKNYEPPV